MRRLLLALALVSAACATESEPTALEAQPAADTSTTTTTTSTTTTTPTTSIPATTTSAVTTTTATTEPPEPQFVSTIRATDADELGVSWREDCPVGVEELRWVELGHWDNDGNPATGVLVVHQDHADDVVTVFERLFEARFPIQSMVPITDFDGDDDASMRANNSSAFNCRLISGTSRWSQHAYGGAIDINPLVNPWVRGGRVDPPEGAAYVDRSADVPGLIVAGDVVTQAFADIGWGWGGDWNSTLDYQHFSHNGR